MRRRPNATGEERIIMSGLCGVVAKEGCSETLLFGTDYHSHLGSQLAGLAVVGETFRKKIHDISQGQFKSKFSDDYLKMEGHLGIGVISDHDAQPLIIHSSFGTYALAMSGLVYNKNELAKMLFKRGSVFTETTGRGINSVELLAKIIETGDNLVDGILSIFDVLEGSASLLLMTDKEIIAARDRLGRLPLVLGQREGEYMVASESCALMNLQFELIKELGPGEIVAIDSEGCRVLREPLEKMQICSFLWIYTGNPSSDYEGVNVEHVRERCGAFLARRDSIEADQVCGVPDSGVGHAVGYASQAGLPYRRPLIKYTAGYGRSYIPPSQAIRDHVAKMKLLAIKEIIAGQRIVVCEDSIVRGTQLKNYTIQKLWNAGAREIHLRPACPPLMFPCRYALSTRDQDELIARHAIRALHGTDDVDLAPYLDADTPEYQRMVDWIRRQLNATTLRYQRLDDMLAAIGLPEEKLCHYCWTGRSFSYEPQRQHELNLL